MGTFSLASFTHREPLRVGALTQSFLASHPAHGQRVVLKQLLPTFATNPEVRERWLGLAAANVNPSAATGLSVFESGECDGGVYLAVEHVEGVGLDVLLRRHKGTPVNVGAAVRIALGILEQLADAQQRGMPFAHLDVGPHSVIVRHDGSVVLTEHGLWNALPPAEAARLRFDKGRVPYLSPELAKSLAGDCRSDVFSVGAILFELLAGTRPFAGNTQLVLALAIAEGKRKTLHDLRPELPEHVRHVVEAMLAHTPEERFQSARAALNALASGNVVGAGAREELAAWVARARTEEGQSASAPRVAASMNAGPSRSATPNIGAPAGPPRTQIFSRHGGSQAASGFSTSPAADLRSNGAPAAAPSSPGQHRSTDVLDMDNLRGNGPRTPTETAPPAFAPPPTLEPYGANAPYSSAPAAFSNSPSSAPHSVPHRAADSSYAQPPAVPHLSNSSYPQPPAVPHVADSSFAAPPAFQHGSAAPLAPPPVFSPSGALDAPALAPPPAMSFGESKSPPPILLEHPRASGSPVGLPPAVAAFDLGKPDAFSSVAASDFASRDGHTSFFKRGNAKHKQAIFVPSLAMPPAPAASAPPLAAVPPLAAPAELRAPVAIPAPSFTAPPAAGGPSWHLAPALGGPSAVALAPAALPEARPVFDGALAPLPRSDDMFRDPSGTLFQMKSYAKSRTAGEKRRMPLGVAVTLAAVFGFVAVTGGYLLFRLLS